MSIPPQHAAMAWFVVIALVVSIGFTVWLWVTWLRCNLRARAYEYGLVVPHANKVDLTGNASIVVLSDKADELWLCVPAVFERKTIEEWANRHMNHVDGRSWTQVEFLNVAASSTPKTFPCEDDSRRRHVKLLAC